jgi:hypothetical protein
VPSKGPSDEGEERSKVNLGVFTFNAERQGGGMIGLSRFEGGRGSLGAGMLMLGVSCAAAAGAIGCGGAPDADPAASVDTLSLIDQELDLAMSGDTSPAELQDRPRGAREPTERDDSPPAERKPQPRAPVSSPERPPPDDRKGADPSPDEPGRDATGESRRDEGRLAEEGDSSGPGVSLRSVAGGATFEVTLNQELSTRHNRVGDLFSATLLDPLTDGRRVLVPAGALIVGEVTAVEESGGHGHTAIINLEIHEVSFEGDTYPLDASILEASPETRSRSSTGSKAAKIGGAAVAGAILGRVIGGDALGTIIGTAVGGAAGTAIVLGTDDVDAVLPRGSRMLLQLDAPLQIQVAMP